MCEDLEAHNLESKDLLDYIIQVKARAKTLQDLLLNDEGENHFHLFDEEKLHLEADIFYLNSLLSQELDPQKRIQIEEAISLLSAFYALWDSVNFYRWRLIKGVLE